MRERFFKYEIDAQILRDSGISFKNGLCTILVAYSNALVYHGDSREGNIEAYRRSFDASPMIARVARFHGVNCYSFFPWGVTLNKYGVYGDGLPKETSPDKLVKRALYKARGKVRAVELLSRHGDEVLEVVATKPGKIRRGIHNHIVGGAIEAAVKDKQVRMAAEKIISSAIYKKKETLGRIADFLLSLRVPLEARNAANFRRNLEEFLNLRSRELPDRFKIGELDERVVKKYAGYLV